MILILLHLLLTYKALNRDSTIWFVGLDVVRTDRSLVFYESETNQAKLWDVLAIYSWVDNDIGYVQGELAEAV